MTNMSLLSRIRVGRLGWRRNDFSLVIIGLNGAGEILVHCFCCHPCVLKYNRIYFHRFFPIMHLGYSQNGLKTSTYFSWNLIHLTEIRCVQCPLCDSTRKHQFKPFLLGDGFLVDCEAQQGKSAWYANIICCLADWCSLGWIGNAFLRRVASCT